MPTAPSCSFVGISKAHTTNLAVVAPGIAEALLATAFGLVAAIPAVIIYNLFARGITGYRDGLVGVRFRGQCFGGSPKTRSYYNTVCSQHQGWPAGGMSCRR